MIETARLYLSFYLVANWSEYFIFDRSQFLKGVPLVKKLKCFMQMLRLGN